MTALASRVRGLSPFGPIFGKELRVSARRKRSYLLRVLYLTALLLAMMAVWSASRYTYGLNGAAARAQAQEQLGTAFFICFVVFTTLAMMVIGPVLTATAISSERLGRTLNVLLMTPITLWQLLSGKLASRLLIALTLIGLSLPVLALSRLLGGVELSQMFGGICLATTVAIHSAAIGLFFSTILRRAFAVILLSYATIGFCQGFLLFAGLALQLGRGRGGEWIWAHVNWFMAIGSIVEPRAFRSGFMSGPFGLNLPPWAVCCVIYLALSAALVLLSALLLRRSVRREGASSRAPDPIAYIPVVRVAAGDAAVRSAGGPPPLPMAAGAVPEPASGELTLDGEFAADAAVLRYASPHRGNAPLAAQPREVSDNPVLWREVRRPLTNRRWQAITFSLIAVGLLLASYAICASFPFDGLDDADTQIGYAIIFHGLLWLLVAVVSATSVAQEKESDTWTLLLTTPITGRTIVFSKAAGLLRRFMWPFALAAGHFALFTVCGVIKPAAFVLVLWVMIAFNAIWLATGIYLSLRLRTVTFAVILNLLLAILVYPVAAALLLIGGEWVFNDMDNTRYRRGGEAWSEQVAWYLPYTYLGIGLDGINRNRSENRSFWLPRNLFASVPAPNASGDWNPYYEQRVNGPTYFAVTFVVGSAYLLAAAAVLLWTAHRFDRIVGRAPTERRAPRRTGPPRFDVAPARG
jgi:ABC-type transport system involved in multi-copper enzyme maturation permease subunit